MQLFLRLTLLFAPCSAFAIVNGALVTHDDPIARSTVAIFSFFPDAETDKQVLYCSGSVISRRTILTAAHCLKGASEVYIVLLNQFNSDTLKNQVKNHLQKQNGVIRSNRFTANSAYNGSAQAIDAGIVVAPEDLPVKYAPIEILGAEEILKLFPKKEADFSRLKVQIAGFGHTANVDENTVRALHKKTVSFTGLLSSGTNFSLSNGNCWGDSGGPAYISKNGKNYILGIASYFGDHFQDCKGYGVYTLFAKNLVYKNSPLRNYYEKIFVETDPQAKQYRIAALVRHHNTGELWYYQSNPDKNLNLAELKETCQSLNKKFARYGADVDFKLPSLAELNRAYKANEGGLFNEFLHFGNLQRVPTRSMYSSTHLISVVNLEEVPAQLSYLPPKSTITFSDFFCKAVPRGTD